MVRRTAFTGSGHRVAEYDKVDHPCSRHSLLYLSHKLILIAVISRAVLLVLIDDELITAHESSYDLRAKGHF
jgi:hypothetical protein